MSFLSLPPEILLLVTFSPQFLLLETVSRVYGTEYLTVDGDLKHILNGTGFGKWDRVRSLRLFGDLDEIRGGQDGGDSDEEYGSHDERLNIGTLRPFLVCNSLTSSVE